MSAAAEALNYESHSPGDTAALGEMLGQFSETGQCIALDGPLGAGKTQLVRGIAAGALVADLTLVSSPTYVLLNIYQAGAGAGAKTVFHLDAYRTSGAGEFAELGFDELLEQGGIVVVEWAEKVAGLLPRDHLHINLEHAGDMVSGERRLALQTGGPLSAAVLKKVRRILEAAPS